jgi:hypothetical protein
LRIHKLCSKHNLKPENIIKYYVESHIDNICQKVLKEQYPGINFNLFLVRDLERHYIANENPTKNNFYYLPKLNINDVLSEESIKK